jgi:hypothetical protein
MAVTDQKRALPKSKGPLRFNYGRKRAGISSAFDILMCNNIDDEVPTELRHVEGQAILK